MVIFALIVSCTTGSYDNDYDNHPVFTESERKLYLNIQGQILKDITLSSKKFFIFPANPNISHMNSHFRKFSDYLYAALEVNGFVAAKTPEKAEIGILLFYGGSYPIKITKTHTLPISGKSKRVASYDTRKNKYDLPIINNKNRLREIYDYHSTTHTTYIYKRIVTVKAIDLIRHRQSDGLHEDHTLWKAQITSSGTSNDLGTVIPHMIAGAGEFFGKNLDSPVRSYINLGSYRYLALRSYVQRHKDFLRIREYGDHIHELYYMDPPTSRPLRLRNHEKPVYSKF